VLGSPQRPKTLEVAARLDGLVVAGYFVLGTVVTGNKQLGMKDFSESMTMRLCAFPR